MGITDVDVRVLRALDTRRRPLPSLALQILTWSGSGYAWTGVSILFLVLARRPRPRLTFEPFVKTPAAPKTVALEG